MSSCRITALEGGGASAGSAGEVSNLFAIWRERESCGGPVVSWDAQQLSRAAEFALDPFERVAAICIRQLRAFHCAGVARPSKFAARGSKQNSTYHRPPCPPKARPLPYPHPHRKRAIPLGAAEAPLPLIRSRIQSQGHRRGSCRKRRRDQRRPCQRWTASRRAARRD